MAYRMLVSDLDETLLNDDGTVNQKNVAAIKAAVAQGFKFVPNTGRSFNSVQPLLEILGLKGLKDQYVISYNGGAIVENAGNKVLLTRALDPQLASQIFEAGIQVNSEIDAHIYTVNHLFIYNLSVTDRRYMSERAVPYQKIEYPNADFWTNAEPIMKVIFEHPEPAVREQIMTQVLTTVGSEAVEATYSSSRYVEFNRAGVEKGSATQLLAEQLGMDMSEVMAIGDNSNDLAMLEAAGLGIAVANGIEEVKKMANVVMKYDNNHGAVAEALEKYVLKGVDDASI